MSHNPVPAPAHYAVYPVQPIAVTRHLGFCLGNAVKYVLRAPYKGGVEDLRKAQQYLVWEDEHPYRPYYGDYPAMCEAADAICAHLRATLPHGRLSEAQAFFMRCLKVYAGGIWREDAVQYASAVEARDSMRRYVDGMIAHLRERDLKERGA
jgi:hypothetical protein